MDELKRIAGLMRRSGFTVEEGVERIRGFTGIVERSYVAGYKGVVKMRVAALPGGGYRVTVLASGPAATRSLAGTLEGMGGSVDIDDDLGRLIAVFKYASLEVVESVIRALS